MTSSLNDSDRDRRLSICHRHSDERIATAPDGLDESRRLDRITELLTQPADHDVDRTGQDGGVDAAIALISQWTKELRKSLIPKPSDVLLVGRGYLESQDYTKAHLVFDLLIKVRPKWTFPLLFKAFTFEDQGRPEDAIALYRKVLTLNPNDSYAINRLKKVSAKQQ